MIINGYYLVLLKICIFTYTLASTFKYALHQESSKAVVFIVSFFIVIPIIACLQK